MRKKNKVNLNETWLYLKKSWKYAKKQKKMLVCYFISTLIGCIIGVVIPMLSAQMLLNMTAGLFQPLILFAITIFLVEMTRNLVHYFNNKFGQIIYFSVWSDIQFDVARETLKLELKELDNNSSGVFADRLNKDTNDIADIFTKITSLLSDVSANIGILFAVFIINIPMFCYMIITMILNFLIERIRMQKFYTIDKKWRKLSENNTGLITELVRGIRVIKVLNASETFINKTEERILNTNQYKYKMREILRRYSLLGGSLRDIFDLGFIFIGIYFVQLNQLSISNFVILFMYRSKVRNLLLSIIQMIEAFKNFNVSASRVFEIIDSTKFKKEQFGTKHIKKVHGDFEFRHVTFGYDKNRNILKDTSFKVKANETVAFVGKSGGGKSTIFSLLNRLYTVKDGNIYIDGIDINELDQDTIRNNMSIITQNPYIFNFSIRDNLKMIKDDLTEEEMIEACKIARLHDFIMELPEQYDTIVGESGVILSGGQRQRLAIARALIKKTEIILFDEATSALDNQTQREIQDAIHHMKGEYTILIIAHRLSTVMDSDRILVVDDGKIVAEGTHQELMKKNDFYRELYQNELS